MSSFAVGLLVGQVSVLVVLAIVVRFFIFADSSTAKAMPILDNKVDVEPACPPTLESILEQTYYNIDTHSAESMDWFTVLLALVINSMREQAVMHDNLLRQLNTIFASEKVPSFIDSISVTALDLGSDFPLLNNCRVCRSADRLFSNGLEVQFDIDLKDTINLGITTRLILNYPRPMLAYLPVSGSISLVNFSGRIAVSLVTDEAGASYLTFSFAPNFSMEFNVDSLVGARSKLQNVPKLGQLVESTLRKRFTDTCVAPNFQKIKLPSWPAPSTPDMRPHPDNAQWASANTSTTGPQNSYITMSPLRTTSTGVDRVSSGQWQQRIGEQFLPRQHT